MTSSLWRNTSLGLFYLNWLFGLFKGLIWGIRGIGLTDPEFSLKVIVVMSLATVRPAWSVGTAERRFRVKGS